MKALLHYAASEVDANLYYATKFLAPDPFAFFQIGSKRFLIASDLEIGRAREQSTVTEVLSHSSIERELKRGKTMADVLTHVLRKRRVEAVTAPANFPGQLADELRRRGIEVDFKGPVFWESRVVKTPAEVRMIEAVQRATEEAVHEAMDVLRRSRASGGLLRYKGEVLTAERVKQVIAASCLRAGVLSKNTIVACGDQGCDPHNRGSGPLRPNRSIVFDVFPRSESTLYFADMSRTVVKGKASKALRRQYDAVEAAQEVCFKRIRDGADGKAIHDAVKSCLVERGFQTGPRRGKMEGFFHGTGHGVGLDIHEAPSIGGRGTPLPKGSVVTVEPGLYYFGVGGVRLEDMVLVEANGCRNLTRFAKELEIA